ncbi:MAG: uroporphyrinogen-III C-methyltransferase [Wenzhouxiangella sp.]|nr:uroporphyrinogen-III C-methyltransferase [Wenzhouxiangella sp.]
MSSQDDKPAPADPLEPKPVDTDEQPQIEENVPPPATAPPARRSGGALGVLALVIALVALATSGWLAYQAELETPQDDPAQQAQALSALEQSIEALDERLGSVQRQQQSSGERLDRVADRVDGRETLTASLEQGLGRVDERTGALAERFDGLEEQLKSLEQALAGRSAEAADLRRRLEAAIEQLDARGDLQREVDRNLRQQMLMLETASLLRMGQDLAETHGDARRAQRVFERARERLSQVDDARIEPVQRALAREIDALAAHAAPNLDVELARLERLGRESQGWPLQLAGAGSASDVAPADAGDNNQNDGWRARLGQTFGALVRVENRDSLGRGEEQFAAAREELQLRLVAAELALMRRDAAALAVQMEAAQALLEAWFDPDAQPVQSARQEFQRLAELSLNPELPALGSALAQLQSRLEES